MHFAYDVRNIKGFIFESNYLRIAAGASFLIKDFEKELQEELKDLVKFIHAAGGTGFGIVKDGASEEKIYEEFDKLKEKYLFDHPIVRKVIKDEEMNQVTFEKKDGELLEEPKVKGFGADLTKVFFLMALEKDSFRAPRVVEIPDGDRCMSCGKRIGKHSEVIGDEKVLICDVCYEKLKIADEKKREGITYNFKEISSKLGNGEKGYMGVFYADGNSMGDIYLDFESEENYKKFSEAVLDFAESVRKEIANLAKSQGKKIASPIFGGDDIMIFMPPEMLWEALKKFDEMEKNWDFHVKDKERKVTFSIGAAVIPEDFPLKFIFEVLSDLQKKAKERRAKEYDKENNFIAFRYFDSMDFEASKVINKEPIELSIGNGMKFEEFKKLVELSHRLKNKNAPKGKLRLLREIAIASDHEDEFEISAKYFLIRSLDDMDLTDKVLDKASNKLLGDLLEVHSALDDWGWKCEESSNSD